MRRLVVALLVLAAACGSDDDPSVAIEESTTTSVTTPGQPPDDAQPGTTAAPGPGAVMPTTDSSGDVDTTGPPGSAAAHLLRPSPSGTLVVEISSEDGAAPADGTLRHLANVLVDVTGKGVTIERGATPPSRGAWSSADVRAAARASASVPQGDPAVIRLLFVHGQHAESDTILGVAVNGDTAAVFVDRVRDSASPLVGAGAIETAVTVHEVGHLLGLVDLAIDRDREDPEHPGHSSNRGSVMYWAVESSLVLDLLTGGPPRDFDADDRADLAAIRAG